MKRIAIAVDSFKGSLSSREVAEAFEEGFRTYFPDCEILKISIADGGEGTVEALVDALHGKLVEVDVCNPLHHPIKAKYGIVDGGRTAIIEMAAASGLPLLKAEERNPLRTSTYGTGEIIADAIKRGCRKFMVGIGGSATNDAGTGVFRALGFRFLDSKGEELVGGGEILENISKIDDSAICNEIRDCEFIVACDVTNPLYGEQGAAYIFAPQKGADATMVEQLDRGLRNFAHIVEEFNGKQIGDIAGAGAAGGLGGGFVALLNAHLVRGIDMVLDTIHFGSLIDGCDLVITGEGTIDHQTLMGKTPSGVLGVASAKNIPTIAIAGRVEWCKKLQASGFASIEAITPEGMSLEEAIQPDVAKANIRRVAEKIAKQLHKKI